MVSTTSAFRQQASNTMTGASRSGRPCPPSVRHLNVSGAYSKFATGPSASGDMTGSGSTARVFAKQPPFGQVTGPATNRQLSVWSDCILTTVCFRCSHASKIATEATPAVVRKNSALYETGSSRYDDLLEPDIREGGCRGVQE